MILREQQLLLIQDMLDEFHFLAADVRDWKGASFLRNDAAPTRYDGNHVRRIRLQGGASIDDFFGEVERFYSYQNFRAVRVDPWTSPLGIEARLMQEGYQISTEIVMATDGPIGGTAADVAIVPLEGEDGWTALRELMAADAGDSDGGLETFALTRRRGKAYSWHLALVDGRPVGHFSERVRGGIGYLEDLMVLPQYRNRGVATALVRRCAESARAKGAGLVFLPADASDTPKDMYRRMGFRPVYVFRNYRKSAGA